MECAGAGKPGELTYAPAVLGLLYPPAVDGVLHPYIGGGLNYTWICHQRDGPLQASARVTLDPLILSTGLSFHS